MRSHSHEKRRGGNRHGEVRGSAEGVVLRACGERNFRSWTVGKLIES